MGLNEKLKRPKNYLLLGVMGAALAICNQKESGFAVKSSPQVVMSPEVSHQVTHSSGRTREALETPRPSEEEPTVDFDRPGSHYMIQEALADCIQKKDNTCYLRYDYAIQFDRTRLECYGNSWKEFEQPLSIALRPGSSGMNVNLITPTAEFVDYEDAPHPETRFQDAPEFYTKICRDALDFLEQAPELTKCEDFEGPGCKARRDNSWLVSTLNEDFQYTYNTLRDNDFVLRDNSAHFLQIKLERADGGSETQTFFPQKDTCIDDELGEVPCWKFRRDFGGSFEPEEVLGVVIDEQLRLYDEE